MQRCCPVLILFSLMTLGLCADAQSSQPSGAPYNTNAPVSTSSVAGDAPVITIDSLCGDVPWSIATPVPASTSAASPNPGNAGPQGKDANCKTVITRAAFEKLAGAVTPGNPPQANLQLAHFYSEQLVLAHRAHQLGLDNDPAFKDFVNYRDLEVLFQAMNKRLQQQAENMPEAEFEKYYAEHPKEFEQVELLRLAVPKRKQQSSEPASPAAEGDPAADEAGMKAEADKLRTQAIAGGDFEKLQDEAYTFANADESPLDPAMGKVTRARVGQLQKLVFDELQPGQVSELISLGDEWLIFKVVSKGIMPRDEAKADILQHRMKEAWDSLRNSAKPKFNDDYFKASANAGGHEMSAAETGPAQNNSTPVPLPTSSVASDVPVITIDGLCDDVPWSIAKAVATSTPAGSPNSGNGRPQGKGGDCKTVITRAAFEKLARAVAPANLPQSNLSLASEYSEKLIVADRAHQLGLDTDPHFDEILRFTNLQALYRVMSNYLQQQADNLSPAEFDKYYKEHSKEFEEVELLQLTIPKKKVQSSESAPSAPPRETDTAADEAAMKTEAEKLRNQAVAGGDFAKLEEEAYAVAGDPDSAPDPAVGKVNRDTARQFQKLIFDELHPGQVSELVTYQDFWLVFKVVSKQLMPRDEARKFTGPWMKEAMDLLKNSVKSDFNDAYFSPSPAAQAPKAGQP
jgi:hypothetical protein